MNWYIVYKGKPIKGTFRENLEKAGITYFYPTQKAESLEDDRMVVHDEPILSNLVFIKTDNDIAELARAIDGLKYPYINRATGRPAIVHDEEMQRFVRIIEAKNLHAEFLADPYKRFESCPRVRVKAGNFAGIEGHVFRIRHDRKLIIALDDIAIAISGIHHTLLEVIDERNN